MQVNPVVGHSWARLADGRAGGGLGAGVGEVRGGNSQWAEAGVTAGRQNVAEKRTGTKGARLHGRPRSSC